KDCAIPDRDAACRWLRVRRLNDARQNTIQEPSAIPISIDHSSAQDGSSSIPARPVTFSGTSTAISPRWSRRQRCSTAAVVRLPRIPHSCSTLRCTPAALALLRWACPISGDQAITTKYSGDWVPIATVIIHAVGERHGDLRSSPPRSPAAPPAAALRATPAAPAAPAGPPAETGSRSAFTEVLPR